MDQITGRYYLVDDLSCECASINFQFNNLDYQFYEVLRTSQGIPIFVHDHLERLNESLLSLGISDYFNEKFAEKLILHLLESNHYQEGNIKLLFRYSHDKANYATYYIPHHYPTETDYKKGVKLTTYSIVRKEPQIKQVLINEQIKNEIEKFKSVNKSYEILLVNHLDCITEGSKSNFFLIKNNILYSSLEKWILKGITRKYILDICNSNQLIYKNIMIKRKDLNKFDAAFICGTSPKVLPVKEINGIIYDINNPLLQFIKEKYDDLLEIQINKI
jgi:branched-chain amino acid aminotransferase